MPELWGCPTGEEELQNEEERTSDNTPWMAVPQPGQIEGKHTYTHKVLGADGNSVATTLTKRQAYVMAAAPELLAACRAALADRFGGDDPCCDADPITNALRAAIRKAEGGRKEKA